MNVVFKFLAESICQTGQPAAVHPQGVILLLDEPLEGLDTSTRREMIELLQQLGREDRQLVMISHHNEDFPLGMTHTLRLKS